MKRTAVALLCCVLLGCDEDTAATPDDAAARDAEIGSDGGGSDGGSGAIDATTPPAGDGIASRYPGDVGIGTDPDVIFADDFEGYASASGLASRWNAGVYHDVVLATDPASVHAGSQALEFRLPQGTSELSNTVARMLDEELDVLYLRYYSRFEDTFDVSGSSHNGGGMSGGYYVGGMASPGVPADGTNKFLVDFECWRAEPSDTSPGALNVYIYHPEQRSEWGDHFFPTGTVLPRSFEPGDFGPEFVSRPDVVPALGRWYSHEIMLRLNTPGMRDGRITLWLDGEVIGDFPNLRLRDVASLRIDRFNLSLHAGANPVRETRKQYDDVVAARSYIGPMRAP